MKIKFIGGINMNQLNLNAIICKEYKDDNIKGIFNTVYLKEGNDKYPFCIVILTSIIGIMDLSGKALRIFMVKDDSNRIRIAHLTDFEIFNKVENKQMPVNDTKIVREGTNILNLPNFEFIGFGEYEIRVYLADRQKSSDDFSDEILENKNDDFLKIIKHISVKQDK